MKRFALLAALAAISLAFLSHPADAKWVQREIKWTRMSQGSPYSGTAIYVRDTSLTLLNGGGVLDTTGIFSLDDAQAFVLQSASGAASRGDSLGMGFLVFQQDTTANTTPAISSLQMVVQGRAAAAGPANVIQGWVNIDSTSVTCVAGTNPIVFPIRLRQTLAQTVGSNLQAFEMLRAFTTDAVGTLASCRAFVRYWVPSELDVQRGD